MAWTKDAYKAGRKIRTRRKWTDEYAKRFKIGSFFQGYDESPRFKGQKIGESQIVAIKKEHISLMPDEDFIREGFSYMQEREIEIWGKDAWTAFKDWRESDETYYVIDFTPNNWDGKSDGVEK